MKPLRLAVLPVLWFAGLSAAGEEPRVWGLPGQVLSAEGRTPPFPTEVVRTASGHVGIFAFHKEKGLMLRMAKDGKAPWTPIDLPMGVAGDARVDGDRVEVVVSDFRRKEATFVAFDFAKGVEIERCVLPGPFPSMPMFSGVAGSGKDRYVLVGCEQGEAMVCSSADGGRSWTAAVQAAHCGIRDDSVAPPMFVSADGVHVVAVERRGVIRHVVSADRGKTWNEGSAMVLPDGQAQPVHVAGAQSGDEFHVVFLTLAGDYVHLGSGDGGATWGSAGIVASIPKVEDMAYIYRVEAEGKSVAVCVSQPGKQVNQLESARVFLSSDAGKTWVDSPVAEGIAGTTGFAAVSLGAGGEVFAAFGCGPASDQQGGRFVLLRRLLPAGAAREEWPDGEAIPEWWKGAR